LFDSGEGLGRRLAYGSGGGGGLDPSSGSAPAVEEYTLTCLEFLVQQRSDEFAERADEWRTYLFYLRNYADVDGRLPESFDHLVSEVFEPLLVSRPGRVASGPRVLVLIPAHNEEQQIAETIDSVQAQTREADRIVVIADNCTDRTVELARSKGIDVFETAGNGARKAGALNQGYAQFAAGFDYVLEMDADTTLHPRFMEEALAEIEGDARLAGVCNRFFAKPAPGLLRRLQALEYVRYEHLCDRRRGRVSVLSGTAVLLRTAALPENPWREDSLVEDYALTLYIRRNGFEVKAGKRAFAYTDTMPTIRQLWRQRLRWERGTLDELRREGWTPYTRRDVFARVRALGGIALRCLYLSALGVAVWLGVHVSFSPIWLVPIAVIAVERVVTAWSLGWKERLLAALFVPEELYDFLRGAWILRSTWLSLRGAAGSW
jgi:cellulose synthase/poly-beta-1,6-N-acetylglucosamine synthase-like glycosyltransferase